MNEVAFDQRLRVEARANRFDWQEMLRRPLDLVISGAALVLLSLPMTILAVLIRIDSAAGIFRQVPAGEELRALRLLQVPWTMQIATPPPGFPRCTTMPG